MPGIFFLRLMMWKDLPCHGRHNSVPCALDGMKRRGPLSTSMCVLIRTLCSNLLSPDCRLHVPAICLLQNDRLDSGARRHISPFSSEFVPSGLLITVTGNQSKIDSQALRSVFRRQHTQGHRARLLAMPI